MSPKNRRAAPETRLLPLPSDTPGLDLLMRSSLTPTNRGLWCPPAAPWLRRRTDVGPRRSSGRQRGNLVRRSHHLSVLAPEYRPHLAAPSSREPGSRLVLPRL